jgi:hypothetical protein
MDATFYRKTGEETSWENGTKMELKETGCEDVEWSQLARTAPCEQGNVVLLSLVPQPSLGLGLLHKIRLNFLDASQHFIFYRVDLYPYAQPPSRRTRPLYLYSPEAGWLPILVAFYDTHGLRWGS